MNFFGYVDGNLRQYTNNFPSNYFRYLILEKILSYSIHSNERFSRELIENNDVDTNAIFYFVLMD